MNLSLSLRSEKMIEPDNLLTPADAVRWTLAHWDPCRSRYALESQWPSRPNRQSAGSVPGRSPRCRPVEVKQGNVGREEPASRCGTTGCPCRGAVLAPAAKKHQPCASHKMRVLPVVIYRPLWRGPVRLRDLWKFCGSGALESAAVV